LVLVPAIGSCACQVASAGLVSSGEPGGFGLVLAGDSFGLVVAQQVGPGQQAAPAQEPGQVPVGGPVAGEFGRVDVEAGTRY
jgi:hypothetical protein